MIVKVQLSLATSKNQQQVLIYNKSRSVSFEGPAPEDLQGTELKQFWHSHMVYDPISKKKSIVSLDRPAPWQNW